MWKLRTAAAFFPCNFKNGRRNPTQRAGRERYRTKSPGTRGMRAARVHINVCRVWRTKDVGGDNSRRRVHSVHSHSTHSDTRASARGRTRRAPLDITREISPTRSFQIYDRKGLTAARGTYLYTCKRIGSGFHPDPSPPRTVITYAISLRHDRVCIKRTESYRNSRVRVYLRAVVNCRKTTSVPDELDGYR